MKIVILAVLVASLGVAACTVRQSALFEPAPVSFAPMQPADVERAVFIGCARRGWIPSKTSDGVVEATLKLRAHSVTVRIEYDRDSFHVVYEQSENLRYHRDADGTQTIHSNYNGWIRYLVGDISWAIEIERARVRQESQRLG